ncbi:hypothetical protein GCM10023196_098700 [Actinoallomurus vinaceus]|uniref:OmpR/PhoB-type domain-containing protein n=1 Tax=Actinoallomurus vinaceus TaxID=1080074 RepID=A0ABP8UWC5_9ACTN
MLGPLHAQITGREVRLDGPRQAKILAALLVDANNLVATERLVAVMWDGKAPATADRLTIDAVDLVGACRRLPMTAGRSTCAARERGRRTRPNASRRSCMYKA